VETRQEILQEIQRVARELGRDSLTLREFTSRSRFSETKILYHFGKWNDAVTAAGLQTNPADAPPPAPDSLSDEDLLAEIGRLWQQSTTRPTTQTMNSAGAYSDSPYRSRWGSFPKAVDEYVRRYGEPVMEGTTAKEPSTTRTQAQPAPLVIPKTAKPKAASPRGRLLYGEPIDFRGLRYAPVNEQGVVYLFGMVSRELGFLIESIRTDFPDCEGKRALDKTGTQWQHVRIEFEYRSSNFLEHGHDTDGCDLIVCWIHDWEECPLEVLELKSIFALLPNR
jgi:hypothetical protein